jgi:hypothetical protein
MEASPNLRHSIFYLSNHYSAQSLLTSTSSLDASILGVLATECAKSFSHPIDPLNYLRTRMATRPKLRVAASSTHAVSAVNARAMDAHQSRITKRREMSPSKR